MFGKLKKYGWLIGVLITTISSLVGAWSTNRLIAQKLAPPEKVEGLPAPGAGARLAASAGRTPGAPAAPAPLPAAADAATPGAAAAESAPEGPGAVAAAGAAVPPGLDPAADAAKAALAEAGGEAAPVGPEGEPPVGAEGGGGEASPSLSSGLLEYEIILKRNIFDHTNPLSFTGPIGTETEGAESGPKNEPLNVRLYGTVVAYPAQFSWAILSKNENNAMQETFRLGEDLYGMGTVAAVNRNQIVVRLPDGGESVVELYTGQDPATQASAASPDSPGGEGIRKLGDNRFEIDQREIVSALDNMDSLTKGARIVPSFEGGQANGFKVMRIKPDSIYNKLGIRNGDVIQRINGFELNSTEKALQMYQMLKTEKNISLDITRRGQKMTMEYSIR